MKFIEERYEQVKSIMYFYTSVYSSLKSESVDKIIPIIDGLNKMYSVHNLDLDNISDKLLTKKEIMKLMHVFYFVYKMNSHKNRETYK